jgi:hypothetical protein
MPRLKQIGIDVDVNGVIESHRRSFAENENDILRRLLLPEAPNQSANRQSAVDRPESENPVRIRGQWTIELNGRRTSAPNLKSAYRALLLLLADAFPDFLERFSREKARSRRFVARTPTQLYLASPALAKDHAKPLINGWFFDTNLSTEQVSSRARIAARLCGLHYGTDVRILNNLEEI